jgi:cyanate permease
MIFYILFFYFAFRVADRGYSRREANILLKAVLVTTFIVTLVITGLYNKSALDPYLVISGYFMGISMGIQDC